MSDESPTENLPHMHPVRLARELAEMTRNRPKQALWFWSFMGPLAVGYVYSMLFPDHAWNTFLSLVGGTEQLVDVIPGIVYGLVIVTMAWFFVGEIYFDHGRAEDA